MAKLCYLEGEPYLLTLPSGDGGKENDWVDFCRSGKNKNRIIHAKGIYSWVSEKPIGGFENRLGTVRGGKDEYGYLKYERDERKPTIGFRPCLIPLQEDELTPSSVFQSLPNGTAIRAGALFLDKKPIYITDDVAQIFAAFPGGVKSSSDIRIQDSPQDRYVITWLVCNGKLIADRNILTHISWWDLVHAGIANPNECGGRMSKA